MTVRPFPKKEHEVNPKLIEEFINKANPEFREKKEEESKPTRENWQTLSLRLPPEVIKQIDESRMKKGWESRNSWILEAIQEKINEK